MLHDLPDINESDRARIRTAMESYTAAIAAAPDPKYWSPGQRKPYVFDGSLSDLYVLSGIHYDGPNALTFSTENDAWIWANVIVGHTSFEWAKLADGTMCIYRREYPYLLALPVARFLEAENCNLVVGNMQTVEIVTRDFIIDCLVNGLDRADVQCLIDSVDPEDQKWIARLVAAM